MYSYVITMSHECTPMEWYVTRIYSYVIRMPSLCRSYVFVSYPYVTLTYSYFIRMPLVCDFSIKPIGSIKILVFQGLLTEKLEKNLFAPGNNFLLGKNIDMLLLYKTV